MELWWIYLFGILAGIFLTLWLRERPAFECFFCAKKVKYWQPHCHDCGRKLQWDWIRRMPYIHSQRNIKWKIKIPNVEDKPET